MNLDAPFATIQLASSRVDCHHDYIVHTPRAGAHIDLRAAREVAELKLERYGKRPLPYIFNDEADAIVEPEVNMNTDRIASEFGYDRIIIVKPGRGRGRGRRDKIRIARFLIKKLAVIELASMAEAREAALAPLGAELKLTSRA